MVSGQSVHFPHAQHRNLVDAQNEHQLKIDTVQNQLAKSLGHFGQLKKPDELVGRDSQIFARQLAKINGPKWPVEGSQGGTPCPVI